MNSDLIFDLPILIKTENSDIDTFIDFWTRFYEYDGENDKVYYDNLKPIGELTADNIRELYKWKNGMQLSGPKNSSVNKIIQNLDEIKSRFTSFGNSNSELKEIFDYSKKNIFTSGYIWNLFFLHILKNEFCPIVDQYVFRVFNFICNGKNEKLEPDWEIYLKYMVFFNTIISLSDKKRKELDNALWGFGKFLSSDCARILIGDGI